MMFRSPCSTATSPAYSPGSAPFAAICASRARGGARRTAQRLLARNAPGDWNQALMELGEIVCTPQSRAAGLPGIALVPGASKKPHRRNSRPRKKRAPVKIRIAAAILRDPQGRTLLVRIPARTTTCSSRACGNSPPSKSRATQNRNWPSTSAPLSAWLRLRFTRSAARSAPRRHLSQHHAVAVSRARPATAEAAAHAHRRSTISQACPFPAPRAKSPPQHGARTNSPLADSRRTRAPNRPGC